MGMRRALALAALLVVAMYVEPRLALPLTLAGLWIALAVGALVGALVPHRQPTPATIRYLQPRRRLGWSVGLIWIGGIVPFPFVTIYRRRH